MKFLVVGLGSMGKRRIRNLRSLGHSEIVGFDPREDRRAEARSKYGVVTYASWELAVERERPDSVVISTSPDLHMQYAERAVARGLHCFVEASVVEGERIKALHKSIVDSRLVVVPSCTMKYFPGPRKVGELIRSGCIGRPLSLNYLTGQYLPDWHPWEHIRDYYVSRRETGGAREIVPFELTWINDIFGEPTPLSCVKRKLTDMEADIDDIYHMQLEYPGNVLASITIDVLSRPRATREFHVFGSEGRLDFSGEENAVRYIRVGDAEWNRTTFGVGTVEDGYINPEEPYVSEMNDFVKAAHESDRTLFPNSLIRDACILELLNRIESLDRST